MQFSYHCIECMLRMQLSRIRTETDHEKKRACALESLSVFTGAPAGVAAPFLVPQLDDIFRAYFGGGADPHLALKQHSNALIAEKLPAVRARVLAAEDPLRAALLCSRAGNYIDFSVIGDRIDHGYLDRLLEEAVHQPLNETEYRNFRRDLEIYGSLLLITDNAGEIVLDRLLLEVLRMTFPRLEMTVCVRGGPSLNDALRADAEAAGIPEFARIIDNGSRIGGMELEYLGETARRALDAAPLILTKGQANLETLLGCGKNIYYLFLCKCSRFVEMFGVPAMTGMFLNEQRLRLADPLA